MTIKIKHQENNRFFTLPCTSGVRGNGYKMTSFHLELTSFGKKEVNV